MIDAIINVCVIWLFCSFGWMLAVRIRRGDLTACWRKRWRFDCAASLILAACNFYEGDMLFATIWAVVAYLDWTTRPPDDKWKKRRKKAAAKIKEVAGKLVVVPIPAPTNT